MDPIDRIAEEFDRLVALGREGVANRPRREQVVYYVVAARCEIDIVGFASLFEQGLNPAELGLLVDGLEKLGETDLSADFRRGLERLKAEGFYHHKNWRNVSEAAKEEIDLIGERVGSRLWELDEKLAALLDDIRK